MCPLRLILILLSATLAGFFVIRNLKSDKLTTDNDVDVSGDDKELPVTSHSSFFSKVRIVVESGFWSCIDMASGRYLWRHLVSNTKASSD